VRDKQPGKQSKMFFGNQTDSRAHDLGPSSVVGVGGRNRKEEKGGLRRRGNPGLGQENELLSSRDQHRKRKLPEKTMWIKCQVKEGVVFGMAKAGARPWCKSIGNRELRGDVGVYGLGGGGGKKGGQNWKSLYGGEVIDVPFRGDKKQKEREVKRVQPKDKEKKGDVNLVVPSRSTKEGVLFSKPTVKTLVRKKTVSKEPVNKKRGCR